MRATHVWMIPNERLSEFIWSGEVDGLAMEIRPIALDETTSMLPFSIIGCDWIPASLLEALSTCTDRIVGG